MSSTIGCGDLLIFRGAVHPWMCDAMGHMNVRHYTGLFDDCCWHVLTYLLPPQAEDPHIGWVAATMKVDFAREVITRTMLILVPEITRVGSKSISTRIDMRDASTGLHYATANFVSVLFDLANRTSLTLPDSVRLKAQQMNPPAHANE